MEFTGTISGCCTYHSAFDNGDRTLVQITDILGKNPEHVMSAFDLEISGSAKDMQKFVDGQKACHKKNKRSKVRITVDFEEGEGYKTSSPLQGLPLSTLIALALN